MKRVQFLSLAILFIFFQPAVAREIKQVVFAENHCPPYTFEKNGIPVGGYAIDITREIFSRLDIKADIRIYPWNRVLKMAEHGRIDGIMLLSKNPEREKYLLYTDCLFEDWDLLWYAPGPFMEKWGRPFAWNDFKDLKPYLIGGVSGYGYGSKFQTAKKKYKLNFETAITSEQNFLKLVLGRIDLHPGGKIDSLYIINRDPRLKGKIRSAAHPFRDQPIRWYAAISRKSKASRLLPRINKVIQEMREDGFMERLMGNLSY